MTNKETLEDMKNRCSECKTHSFPDEEECEWCYFPPAIKALEKQIPKKSEDSYIQANIATRIRVSVCPVCKAHLIVTVREQQKYCDNCGQAIEWSEEDD